ncbi:MAG TPA: RNA 2',3'-cyclic phosphodiesterase [Terracidiphilus sp.]|jgi:2'-5' RNA ligase
MRLFIGIPLATEVVDALERITNRLRTTGDNLRWASPETWHITLQFLGETSPEQYDCTLASLRRIRSTQVPVWLEGTGVFDRAGVFFAGVNVSPELRLVQKLVTAATAKCGFSAEDRPYHPHVTLARAKGDKRHVLRKLKDRADLKATFPRFTANAFLLYEAFLGPGGSRYEVRERFPLGKP